MPRKRAKLSTPVAPVDCGAPFQIRNFTLIVHVYVNCRLEVGVVFKGDIFPSVYGKFVYVGG